MIEESLPGLRLFNRGKVRDIYDLGDNLLLVATDRISAFDVILPTPIPGKGKILTALSEFWFGIIKDIIPNHLITTSFDRVPRRLPPHIATNWRAARCWSKRAHRRRWNVSCAAIWQDPAGRIIRIPAACAVSGSLKA